jgi:hypothetical protein
MSGLESYFFFLNHPHDHFPGIMTWSKSWRPLPEYWSKCQKDGGTKRAAEMQTNFSAKEKFSVPLSISKQSNSFTLLCPDMVGGQARIHEGGEVPRSYHIRTKVI